MKGLIENIYTLITGSRTNAVTNSEYLTIGNNVFAVAHSPQEIKAAMKNSNVAAYIFSPRTLPQLKEHFTK